jgi:hypothetical protein
LVPKKTVKASRIGFGVGEDFADGGHVEAVQPEETTSGFDDTTVYGSALLGHRRLRDCLS